jgi:alkylation response protein AidB-like acyl-CoA dehydrogenase
VPDSPVDLACPQGHQHPAGREAPGFVVSRDLPKLGYKGVESCELSFAGYRTLVSSLPGGVEGQGFA